MDMKLYTDFLLSKEIELKECEADLLRIVGRLHQAGIRVELPTPKRNNEQNTKSSHKIEAKSSELHNTCYTNEGDNKDELQTAHAAVVGPSAEGFSSLYEEALKEPNFDDFGVSKKNIELLELWKLGITLPVQPTSKSSIYSKSSEYPSFKPPVTMTFKDSDFTYTPELFEKSKPTRTPGWKNETTDFTISCPKLKLDNMESPFKTPPSMKYKVLQYNMDTPNCQELQNNFESLTITKPIKPSHSLNNAGKENQFEKSKSRYYSYYSTPQKSPEEPQLLTPSRNQKEFLDLLNLGVPVSPELVATKWL